MKSKNWIWMPHHGHFICGKDCRFHLNTYVNGYIVSTIGELWPDSRVRAITASVQGVTIIGRGDFYDADYMKKIGYQQLGFDRLYETMVFKAEPDPKHGCCPFRMNGATELDFAPYNTAHDAFKGHYAMCKKWEKKGTQ